MQFIINYPSLDKLKKLITEDENKKINNMKLCEDKLNRISLKDLKDEDLLKIFNERGIDYFTDYKFQFSDLFEIEVDKNE